MVKPLTGTTTREPITQENIDLVLSNLNSVYAPIKVKFVHDGRINYIDNSKLLQEKSISVNFISFTSSNVNLKIFPIGSAGSAGNLYVNGIDGPFGNGGITILDSDFFLSPTTIHEMGHALVVSHTFKGARLYDNPADPIENSPMILADRDTRELVIREPQEDGTANFLIPNHETAGDKISDTPAFGRGNSTFPDPDDPDCFVYNEQNDRVENCTSGFNHASNTCNYLGNYVDYNGHELTNIDIGISNFMSYTGTCRNSFTEGQLLKQSMTAREVAVTVWDPSKGTQFVDSVQFWHTTIPVKNANITLRHLEDGPAGFRYSQVTTPTDGSFSAKLFDGSVKAKSIVLGSGEKNQGYIQRFDTSYAIFNYTEADWVNDVTTADIVWLTRYILGVESLNPFQKLAADVNRDGELTVGDIIDIKRLILGLDVEFIDYPSGPWQFVPEVVS